jgi:hypothetical protein
MRTHPLLPVLLLGSACATPAGKSARDSASDSGSPSGDGDGTGDGGDGANDDILDLSGTLDCDGCGTVVIAVFDSAELAGAPLLDTVVDAAEPFSLSVADPPGSVWLFAFDDTNGNHAPDPEEATGLAGPFSDDTADIVIALTGGGGGGDTVTLSGTLSCFEGCHPPFVVGVMAAGDTEWTPVGILEDVGSYSIEVPAGLGVVDLIAVEDLNGSRDYEPPEELGAIEAVVVGDEDLDGLDIDVLLEETWVLSPGVEDELGLPVAVQELILLLDGSRTALEVAAELGLTVRHDIDGVGIVVETGISALDSDPLGELASLMAAAERVSGVETVLQSAYVTTSEARETDDNASLAAGLDWAFGLLRVADAKDQLHDCAIHLDSSARSLSAQVGIVDFDLQGARDASEFTGVIGSFTDHHTADEDDVETHGAHGSMVASQIGARNDGTGMNGLLAGFTGTAADGSAYELSTSLHLHNIGHQSRESDGSGGTVMRTNTTSGALLAAIGAAMAGPSTVVNASIGVYAGSLGHLRYTQGLRASIEKILDQHSSTVLVLSAGNDNRDIGKGFHLSSMDKANLLVVGATTDTDARASFSNYGRYVDLAAPGQDVYGFTQEVDHEGTTTTLGASSYGPISGTSFAAPITAANVALIQAFDPAASPASVVARLQRAADPITAELGGHRVHTRRTVQFQIEQHLNTTTEWLLDFEATLTSITGDGCAAALAPSAAAQCMPMVPSGGGHALATGITDINGNTQTMELALGGTTTGSSVSLVVEGQGTSFGVGPATATYTGTVGADPHDPVPVPGDLYVSGTFSGGTPSHPDLSCSYSGTWEGWLRRSTP